MTDTLFNDRSQQLSARPPHFIETTAIKQSQLAANMAIHHRAPVAILGPPGVGKTTGAEEAARRCKQDVVYACLGSGSSVKQYLNEIHHKATGYSARGTVSQILGDLIAYLSTTPTLIIIDDADNLPPKGVETIVSLHNSMRHRTGGGQPLVLVANSLDKQFAQSPALYSRVASIQRLSRLSFEEVQGFLPTVGPIFEATDLSTLAPLNGVRYFDGDIRRWLVFAATVNQFAGKAKTVTQSLVDTALQAMDGGL